jgi:hypothetical protein
MQISRSGKRIAVLLLGLSLSLAGCGFSAETSSQPNGRAATLNLSLKTVPTVRSITISPGKATFANCTGGKGNDNTASAGSRLGYPNGVCWIGESSPIGLYPIKVINTGIASFVYVSGSNATPSDGGDDWALCNVGKDPAVTCSGYKNSTPGVDQYIVRNFGPDGSNNTGLTGTPQCDRAFGAQGKCWAGLGASQQEGFELIGPSAVSDTGSTNWTITITWTPVPTEGS